MCLNFDLQVRIELNGQLLKPACLGRPQQIAVQGGFEGAKSWNQAWAGAAPAAAGATSQEKSINFQT